MVRLKEDEVYVAAPLLVADDPGLWVCLRDTLFFDQYDCRVPGARVLSRQQHGSRLLEVSAILGPDRSQTIGVERCLLVDGDGLSDACVITNTSGEPQTVSLVLELRPRFIDLFAVRTDVEVGRGVEIEQPSQGERRYWRRAEDGVVASAELRAEALPQDLVWSWRLAPGETLAHRHTLSLTSSEHDPTAFPPLPDRESWARSFAALGDGDGPPAVQQAVEDLRTLLLRTRHGPYPAAGMPFFVNFFGRDALITAMLIARRRPDVLRAVLSFLAAEQGRAVDPFREEEPGKILHEIRRGELSRTNRTPFGRYYGSVDSTPLFLMAAGVLAREGGDIAALRGSLTAALRWVEARIDGETGLARFEASGSGLAVQSWKDSPNSMVDAQGRPAKQPLAVAEVQGYCYAALLAAAEIFPERGEDLRAKAERLADRFHTLFWLEDLQTYAMALDGEGRPLRVLSSDPGHLLWCGIVPEAIAPRLVATMMSPALWSGWGVRTLGAREKAYNPVSYHLGSVWPHDTGLFALGLARYGFRAEMTTVAGALLDLAERSPNRHMPELISGFDRGVYRDPVPYSAPNAPQAWSAATVIAMHALLTGPEAERHGR